CLDGDIVFLLDLIDCFGRLIPTAISHFSRFPLAGQFAIFFVIFLDHFDHFRIGSGGWPTTGRLVGRWLAGGRGRMFFVRLVGGRPGRFPPAGHIDHIVWFGGWLAGFYLVGHLVGWPIRLAGWLVSCLGHLVGRPVGG